MTAPQNTACAALDPAMIAAAGRIMDRFTGGDTSWRRRADLSAIYESADWATAVEYAKAALSAAEASPAQTSAVGHNITFSPFDPETGNAVVSPGEPEGAYWTLIAQGGEAEQNAIAAEICRRLNAPAQTSEQADETLLPVAIAIAEAFQGRTVSAEFITTPATGGRVFIDCARAAAALYPTPPALKASELGEDQKRRAVPQSTISEGWREAFIVWNEARNEGVVFVDDQAALDAVQCATGEFEGVTSSLGNAFAELYEDDKRTIERVMLVAPPSPAQDAEGGER